MLKPIPNETAENNTQGIKNRKKTWELKQEKNVLQSVAHQLTSYVSNAKKYSEKEVKILIEGLYRSVLCLQKQRRRSVNKKNKKSQNNI